MFSFLLRFSCLPFSAEHLRACASSVVFHMNYKLILWYKLLPRVLCWGSDKYLCACLSNRSVVEKKLVNMLNKNYSLLLKKISITSRALSEELPRRYIFTRSLSNHKMIHMKMFGIRFNSQSKQSQYIFHIRPILEIPAYLPACIF